MDYSCDCISGFQMEVVTGEKVSGNIDDCKPNACGDGNCVDKVNGYTCNCDAGRELMLQEHHSVCVAKECGTFPLSRMVQWSQRNRDVCVKTCLPGFTLSGGLKCGADTDFVPVGSLPVCSPRSGGVPLEVSGASRSAKEVLFQGSVTYTCDTGYIIGGFATLTREFTRTCGFLSVLESSTLVRQDSQPLARLLEAH